MNNVKQNLAETPIEKEDWIIPDLGMEFVWIDSLNCWAGKYQVTNYEYKKYAPLHDNKEYEGVSLNGDNQPVVYVNFRNGKKYADWLTNRELETGRIPSGYKYRLPTREEWTRIAECGDDRKYPWGNNWPPIQGEAGNYFYNYIENNDLVIASVATCDVRNSYCNPWRIYGVGGNVWELTTKSVDDLSFDAWRGASWIDNMESSLMVLSCFEFEPSKRNHYSGFRLFLSR